LKGTAYDQQMIIQPASGTDITAATAAAAATNMRTMKVRQQPIMTLQEMTFRKQPPSGL
jgi:hypothetical protein